MIKLKSFSFIIIKLLAFILASSIFYIHVILYVPLDWLYYVWVPCLTLFAYLLSGIVLRFCVKDLHKMALTLVVVICAWLAWLLSIHDLPQEVSIYNAPPLALVRAMECIASIIGLLTGVAICNKFNAISDIANRIICGMLLIYGFCMFVISYILLYILLYDIYILNSELNADYASDVDFVNISDIHGISILYDLLSFSSLLICIVVALFMIVNVVRGYNINWLIFKR